MKIQYKIKPEKEWPLKIGDKIRIKKEWLDKLEEIDVREEDVKGFSGEITEIYNTPLANQGFSFCNYSHLTACIVKITVHDWVVPLDCLEKIIKPKKKEIIPVEKKNHQTTGFKGKPITRKLVSPNKIRLRSK